MVVDAVYLKKDEERRLLSGHLWIYSNEIDTKKTSLKAARPGDLVTVYAANGKKLGIGYINPHSLICVRLLTRNCAETIDKQFFVKRLQRALQLRQRYFGSDLSQAYYRLVFGESDNLPGLIVDRFGDVLVVQMNTAGMEALSKLLIDALVELMQPRGILCRNDSGTRELEGLKKEITVIYGEVPQEIIVEEHGVKFMVPLWEGQKTGWFFDQSYNRERLQRYARGARRVLDVFSYVGAWGIQAAVAGAGEVIYVDSSAFAMDALKRNAALNGVNDKVNIICEDAFVALKELLAQGQKFDLIIIDPPAFIKKRKDIKEGTQAYMRLHELALRLLASRDDGIDGGSDCAGSGNGILFTTSCSMHLQRDALLDVVRQAALRASCDIRIMEQLHQAQDHPINPAIVEMEYLKGFVVAVNGKV